MFKRARKHIYLAAYARRNLLLEDIGLGVDNWKTLAFMFSADNPKDYTSYSPKHRTALLY